MKRHTFLNSFSFAIAQEGSEPTGIQVVQDGYKEIVVEFESIRELLGYLPDAVDELQKNR